MFRHRVIAVALSAVMAVPLRAQSAPVLVTADWLATRLNDPKVVVIHASASKPDYDAGHVPGSRWIPWSAYTVSAPGGLSTQLPSPDSLEAVLEAAGISDDTHIVISGGPLQTSGRLFFTLEYMGLVGHVSMLDGGIDAWREAGRPIERAEARTATAGSLRLTPNPARLASADFVHTNASNASVTILDARTPEFYLGASPGSMPRAGHIPGAKNIPFAWLTGELSLYRDRAKLQRLFDNAGAKKGNKIITYCHIGMQASALYTAARLLGYDAAVYDGSWDEWSRKAELPIVGPAKP